MTRNTQALILFFASQFSWAVCCLASAPAFVATTYEDSALQYILMLNGIFITMTSTFLMVLAMLVALDKKKTDQLSPKKLDPKFSVGMGATAFLLILQVILAMSHVALQPDEADFVPATMADANVLEFAAELKDGQMAGGAQGFVVGHPDDGRPIFVTVSQQFCEGWELDRNYSVSEIPALIQTAAAFEGDKQFDLGPAIPFEADALFASGYGCDDSMSDVLFFEAPGLEAQKLGVRIFDGMSKAPDQQVLWVPGYDKIEKAHFGYDADEVWEVTIDSGADVPRGVPVLNYKYEVIGFVTANLDGGDVDVFPMHLAWDYLGVYVSR